LHKISKKIIIGSQVHLKNNMDLKELFSFFFLKELFLT